MAVADVFDDIFAPMVDGRAVTISCDILLPAGVRVVASDEGLPRLPDRRLIILKSQSAVQPLTDAISDMVLAHLRP